MEGVTVLVGFPRTRWPRQWFDDSYAARIFVKIWRICEFRVIMVIMTILLWCCSSSTLGSRANDYVKTLAIWLHHSPYSSLATQSLSPKYGMINVCFIPHLLGCFRQRTFLSHWKLPWASLVSDSHIKRPLSAAEFRDYQLILLVVFWAVDESLAWMEVDFEVFICKWQLVCAFGTVKMIFSFIPCL